MRTLRVPKITSRIGVSWTHRLPTTHKIKPSINDLFSKCDQIRRKLRIWSHLLKKSLMENFIFVQWPFWFLPPFNSVKLLYYQKEINQINLNQATLWNLVFPMLEFFVQISLNVSYSLDKTLLIFLPYVRQTWMTQLTLAILL